jgi:RHS repeat-associated protein
MAMPGRSWAADSSYRFGFNGKENLALAGWQDYGMRIYDRLTSRFISADPLIVYGQKYAELSPYQFAGNRPIDGIDKDGLEWESNKNSSGGIDISVNVEAMFDPEIDENMYLQSGYTKQDYMNAVSEQLDRTMKNSFGNNYSGCVTFNGGNSNTIGQLVPRLIFLGTDAANTGISGMTSNSEASVAMINGGELRSPRDVALDAVHELLHTLRLDHPFELVQTEDTKLIKIGSNEYAAPSTTNDNITHNIMNYGMIRVNGYRLSDYWCVSGRSPDLITSGQLQFINNEILLQKSGCGLNNSIENSSFPKYSDVERRPGYEIECR